MPTSRIHRAKAPSISIRNLGKARAEPAPEPAPDDGFIEEPTPPPLTTNTWLEQVVANPDWRSPLGHRPEPPSPKTVPTTYPSGIPPPVVPAPAYPLGFLEPQPMPWPNPHVQVPLPEPVLYAASIAPVPPMARTYNRPFPYMFELNYPSGSQTPLYLSDNGLMHYYAWGDHHGVAMLTTTMPVWRMQSLHQILQADKEATERELEALRQAPEPKKPRGRPRGQTSSNRKTYDEK